LQGWALRFRHEAFREWIAVAGLLCLFFVFEKLSCLFEIEEVAVYENLEGACVFRNLEDAFNLVTLFANCFDEKIDIYHAWKFTAGWLVWIVVEMGVLWCWSATGWGWLGVSRGVPGFFSHAWTGGCS